MFTIRLRCLLLAASLSIESEAALYNGLYYKEPVSVARLVLILLIIFQLVISFRPVAQIISIEAAIACNL